MGEPILSAGGRAVGDDNEIFVGLDVAKVRHAVAVAEDGRRGEVRFLGEIDAVRWTQRFGQEVKLGLLLRRTDLNDGQTEAIFGGIQGEGCS